MKAGLVAEASYQQSHGEPEFSSARFNKIKERCQGFDKELGHAFAKAAKS